MGGPTGLDYVALFSVLDHLEVAKEDRQWLFADIQAMEAAALKEMRKTFT